ncbi:MAG TPA: SIMPL domain-containing protein [Chthoniobacteraceae bacterium]|nr:SIMPL domain-containing protein [Chthoniobacteraceae bacterium]
MNNHRPWILGLCFVIGMTVFAVLAGHSLRSVKRMDEFVTVKGLSEREVAADLAIWPVAFTVSDNDLKRLQELIQSGRKTVYQFLTESGFEQAEISNAPPQIADAENNSVDVDATKRPVRYRANIVVLLRSSKVAKVKAAMETCDKLVQQGIVLSGGDYASKPQFLFTGLNQIKPDMIQEANRNARKAAEKFASDSNSPIGAVRHAVQGPFEVNDVDSSSPDRKIVRVVTTVDFYLQ